MSEHCPTCGQKWPKNHERDKRILSLAAQGKSAAAIAKAVKVTDRTVQRVLKAHEQERGRGRPRRESKKSTE